MYVFILMFISGWEEWQCTGMESVQNYITCCEVSYW